MYSSMLSQGILDSRSRRYRGVCVRLRRFEGTKAG
jgi:hypothetical protein